MFKDKLLTDRVEYLESQMKEEREFRWGLEYKLVRLMSFLGIYEETQPQTVLRQRKEK